MTDNKITDYYTNQYDESVRLGSTPKGRLERDRVRELFLDHISAAAGERWKVADIGGGPGTHSVWLKSIGHRPWLCDPVPLHVQQAAFAGISAQEAQAGDLPWEDGFFGAALMCGPMYHLPERGDRLLALKEMVRVCRPGAPVAVGAFNRFTQLIGATVGGVLQDVAPAAVRIASFGSAPDAAGWMGLTYGHTLESLGEELLEAGIAVEKIAGVGGPGSWLAVAADAHGRDGALGRMSADQVEACAVESARIADSYPELTQFSSKFLALGYTPS